jgi:uncharacterized membrane protein
MDWEIIARGVHVVAVVLWIGGVAMETMVILPALRSLDSDEARGRMFMEIERRFAPQARVTTLLVGATGFYMLHALDGWSRYAHLEYWWVHTMTLIWFLFTLVLFVLEPWFLHDWFHRRFEQAPQSTLSLILRLHWVLLAASLLTVLGAVAGAHGTLFFNG